jgi:hypothetical protein
MKPIKITETAAVEAALASVNGRAASFTITTAAEVRAVAREAEETLANALTSAARTGARVRYTPAGPSAKSYKNAAVSTTIDLERRTAGWVLVAVRRSDVFPRSPSRLTIQLSPEQHMAAAIRAIADVRHAFDRTDSVETGSAHADLAFIEAAAKKAGIGNAEVIARALLPLYAN